MGLGGSDVTILPIFGTASQENHQFIAVLAEINPVSGTKIQLVLTNALSDWRNVGKITVFHARKGSAYL